MASITVRQFIKLLQAQPQDAKIMLACDEEGNAYAPLTDNCIGDEGFATKDLTEMVYSYQDVEDEKLTANQLRKYTKAIIIYPN